MNPMMIALEGASVSIDTTALVQGLTTGTNGMVTQFMTMLKDFLPVVLPVLGVTIGISFAIRFVRGLL